MDRLSPLANVGATRAVLEKHGLGTRHALGQNFLISDDIVRKIIELAALSFDDCVLEVGPGIGTLTIALLKSAGRVVSVEMDRNLPDVLADTLAPWEDRFTLIQKDGLDLGMSDLEQVRAVPTAFVSNLPYAVAATIVLDYFERFDSIRFQTVMVQKEVADRMMARPGTKEYGAYTVKLSLFAQPTGRFRVAPGNFFPPPHVDSAVVRLDRTTVETDDGRALTPVERRSTCTMVDAAFATRRKTLANSCRTYFSSKGPEGKRTAEMLPALFERAGIDPKRRGETLDQAEFIRLGLAYAQVNGASTQMEGN